VVPKTGSLLERRTDHARRSGIVGSGGRGRQFTGRRACFGVVEPPGSVQLPPLLIAKPSGPPRVHEVACRQRAGRDSAAPACKTGRISGEPADLDEHRTYASLPSDVPDRSAPPPFP